MKTVTCIILLIFSGFHDFQLSQVNAASSRDSGSVTCAVLTCVEEITSNDQALTATSTDSATSSSQQTITSMNIYRKTEPTNVTSSKSNDGRDEGHLLVTVTKAQVTVLDSSLDIVFSGRLEVSLSTLKVGLMTLESCQSEYTCEAVMTDQYGGQHVSKLRANIDHLPNYVAPTKLNWQSTKAVLENPLSCEKDMISMTFQNMYPYLVVNPNEFSVAQVPILCETGTLGGGWVVFQRRSTGNVDFYRGWEEYKNGFGSLTDDFWMGLDTLHTLTASGTYELMIMLEYNGKLYSAQYQTFSVSGEEDNYRMFVERYTGTAGDSFGYHNGMAFSTFDNDNDADGRTDCAADSTGAWWYNSCQQSNLNGLWQANSQHGLRWFELTGDNSVSFSQMMIRRVN